MEEMRNLCGICEAQTKSSTHNALLDRKDASKTDADYSVVSLVKSRQYSVTFSGALPLMIV